MQFRHVAIPIALLLLPACRSTIREVAEAANDATQYPFKTTLTLAAIGAAAYYVVDPLAPNWEVAHEQIGGTRYRIDLRMKRFHLGADGESDQVFKRHAEDFAERLGNGEYRLVSYSEGIDSNMSVPRRWGRGVIELLPAHSAQRDSGR
ncbi:MAG: hypothetical protein EXR36_11630 [Betaproteobacteria bacterium]|nr:hypothetical protein [Betaproteobacteria bacterium]